mmetsp:Transcript_98476/g.301269  ORF Transcript_98476/g.301269 Transcript_98476/m.301269 type:complete len:279 (+) Transcript_98476:989-1825(+)
MERLDFRNDRRRLLPGRLRPGPARCRLRASPLDFAFARRKTNVQRGAVARYVDHIGMPLADQRPAVPRHHRCVLAHQLELGPQGDDLRLNRTLLGRANSEAAQSSLQVLHERPSDCCVEPAAELWLADGDVHRGSLAAALGEVEPDNVRGGQGAEVQECRNGNPLATPRDATSTQTGLPQWRMVRAVRAICASQSCRRKRLNRSTWPLGTHQPNRGLATDGPFQLPHHLSLKALAAGDNELRSASAGLGQALYELMRNTAANAKRVNAGVVVLSQAEH